MNQTYWFAIIGMAMAPVISFLKAKRWSVKTKALISMLVCVVASGAQAVFAGSIHGVADLVSNWATIWASSQVVYHGWFGATDWNSALEGIGVK